MVDKISTPISEILAQVNKPEFVINGDFRGKDIISIEQFGKEDIVQVLTLANQYKKIDEADERKKYKYQLEDKRIAVCFYQPSTRTYLSFMAAGQELGAQMLGYPGMVEFSSVNI